MGITEKAAYLQGLVKGLEIDDSTKEGKLLIALVDVVDEMAASIADLEEVCEELDEVVDVLDEDLGNLEDDFYSFDDDELDFSHDCCEDEDCDCDEDEVYEVTCPSCENSIYLDAGMLDEGSIDCPNCGQLLEFDYSEEETEE